MERAGADQKQDKGFVLSCVQKEGLALQAAPKALRADADVVAAAVAEDGLALRFAAKELRKQKGLVLVAVRRAGLALAYASLDLRRDREVVLAAVQEDGLALEHAARELRGDRGVVLAAVEQNGEALEHARSALRDDRAIVLPAVRCSGCALEFASDALRADVEVCRVACRSDPEAVHFIEDPEVKRQVRAFMIQDKRGDLARAGEEDRRRAEEARRRRLEASEALLKELPRAVDAKRDRRRQLQRQAQPPPVKALAEVTSVWAEKVISGGRLYRMIEGWREENMDKFLESGSLDLGDPWERKSEKPRPAPPQPVAQTLASTQPGVAGQPQQRTVVSMVRREVYSGPEPSMVRTHILGLVQGMTGTTDLEMDTALMDSGIDSIASVDLRTQLQNDFKVQLSSAVMFNYPSMGALTSHIVEELTAHKVPGWGKVVYEEVPQEVVITVEQPQQAPQAQVQPAEVMYQGPDPELVRKHLLAMVLNMTGSSDMDMDTPLMESGIDSIASVDLRSQMQKDFTVDLPSTVMFNYPTMLGLTDFLLEQLNVKRIPWGRK